MPREMRNTFGPVWAPVNSSGITWPGCSHRAPDECSACNGDDEDARHERARLRALERQWERVIAERNRARRAAEQNGDAA